MDNGILRKEATYEQDRPIDVREFLAGQSAVLKMAACDWHETDCNYTCQCNTMNTQCVNCQGAVCQSCECSTMNNQCVNCEGVVCQTCQCSKMSNQGSPPSSSGILTIGEVTDTTISVKLASIPGAAWYNIAWHKDGEPTKDQVTTELFYEFTGLTPEKKYIFNYYGVNDYGTGPYATTKDATTLKKKPVIARWSWNTSNGVGGSSGTASAAKTQAAYRAILNEGYGEDFSYKVWNDLANKINEVVVAIGKPWANTYATLSGTKMGGAGQKLTAVMYNAAKQNVGSHYPTGIPEVNGTTEFTWSYIDKLVIKLNEWIASL